MSDAQDIVERLRRRTFRPCKDMIQEFNEQGNLTNGDALLHEQAAEELELLRAAADAVLSEARFYGAIYGVTREGKAAMEALGRLLRPAQSASQNGSTKANC